MTQKKKIISLSIVVLLIIACFSAYWIVKPKPNNASYDPVANSWFSSNNSSDKIDSYKYKDGANNLVFHVDPAVKSVKSISCSTNDIQPGSQLSSYVSNVNPEYNSTAHTITITITQNYSNTLEGGNQYFSLYINALVDNKNYNPLGLIYIVNREDDDWLTTPEVYSYIYERTFSIAAITAQSWIRGTGWLLNHTPTDINSPATKYEYWMATNMHVTEGFKSEWNKEPSTLNQISYASLPDPESDDVIENHNSYTLFSASTIQTYEWYNPSAKYTIDMAIIKVNFGTVTPGSELEAQLDTINSKYEQNNHVINTFTHIPAGTLSSGDSKFISGYPAREGEKTVCAKEQVVYSKTYGGDTSTGHSIGNATDISPGLKFFKNSAKTTGWKYTTAEEWKEFSLSGGASGSMAVIRDPDSIYGVSICGIYWGGWKNTGNKIFYPDISCFNAPGKELFTSYTSSN